MRVCLCTWGTMTFSMYFLKWPLHNHSEPCASASALLRCTCRASVLLGAPRWPFFWLMCGRSESTWRRRYRPASTFSMYLASYWSVGRASMTICINWRIIYVYLYIYIYINNQVSIFGIPGWLTADFQGSSQSQKHVFFVRGLGLDPCASLMCHW